MAERFEIDQIIEIFDADSEFISQIGTLSTSQKEELAELLIDNKIAIADDTARDLATSGYLSTNINGLGISSSFNSLLQIYYTFKYAAIKLFFRENYHKYIPEYDLFQIKRNDNLDESDKSKNQLLVEACMREFDRFSLIIDNITYTQDLNKVPYDYLNYLAQLIGYQRDDYLLLSNATFRELLKNIIEIYKIKGSNYSFELFFNFLGFDITINEYWFDKRYGDDGIVTNQHTGSVNKKSHLFYLTPIKPTKIIPDDMLAPYTVNEDQIISPKNINMFIQYTGWKESGDSRGFTYKQLIGDTTGYTEDIYTFFKTNIIQYSLSSLGTEQEPELDADELEKIEFYAKFLSPIYVQRQISVITDPYSEDSSQTLGFRFLDRADPIYRDQINYSRNYYVRSIDANVGDTRNGGDSSYDDRAIVVVDDSNQELFNWIHRNDYIYLSGDTTAGDINQGSYFVAGDSYVEKVITNDPSQPIGWRYTLTGEAGDSFIIEGDSYKIYDSINSRTWIILKGPLSSAAGADKGDFNPGATWLIGDTFQPYTGGDTYLGTDQTAAGGYLFIGGPDTMMHLYEGSYPNRYYWGDSVYGDSSFTGFGDTRAFTVTPGDSLLAFDLFIGDSIIEEHNFVSGMPVTYICDNELIDRPDCESTTAPGILGEIGSAANATWERSSDFSHGGDYSYKATKTVAVGVYANVRPIDGTDAADMHGIAAGQTYPFSIWVYVPTASGLQGDEVIVQIGQYDSVGGWVNTDLATGLNTLDVWQELKGTFTVNSNTVGFYFVYRFEHGGADSGEYFYTDDISLHNVNSPHNSIQTIVKEIGDTYILVEDPVASGDSYGNVFVDNRQFRGHYISGHHTDTHYSLYGDSINGDTNPISAYAVIKNANPTWSEEQVFININEKETDQTLYDYETTTFKVRPRELLVMVDTVRKNISGDSTWSAGDTFVVGDTYLKRVGDSKSRLYLGDTLYYTSTGDSVHGHEANTYVLISGNYHMVTAIGDTYIEISPWFENGASGIVQKIPSWKKYTAVNEGDTNSYGDSIFDFHAGFINPVYNNVADFSETGPLTLGANFPITPEDIGRPIEIQETISRYRSSYWVINYSDLDSDVLNPGQVYRGNSSNSMIWLTSDRGDSNFYSIYKSDGNFTYGERLQPVLYSPGDTFGVGDSWYLDINGDSAVIDSKVKYTDQRGLILDIDATAGEIQVYDPGDSGDSTISEWARLIWDDYVIIHDALNDSNNGEYQVSSSVRIVPGDTTVITLGDSIIGGVDQTTSSGYVGNVRKSKILSLSTTGDNIEVHDTSRKFNQLAEGDTIVIEDTGDSNEGTYVVGDSIFHLRTGTGDSVGTTTFNVSTALDHDSGDSGGTVELNRAYWLIGDSRHQNGFDYLEFIKMR